MKLIIPGNSKMRLNRISSIDSSQTAAVIVGSSEHSPLQSLNPSSMESSFLPLSGDSSDICA